MVALAVLAASAVLAAPAPDGFRHSPQLSVRVSKIATTASYVYCAGSSQVWDDFAIESTGRGGSGVYGLASRTERAAYFAPGACRTLENRLRGRPTVRTSLAIAILSFVHESLHLRGWVDEHKTECRAVFEFRRWARALFGVKNARALRLLYRDARAESFC